MLASIPDFETKLQTNLNVKGSTFFSANVHCTAKDLLSYYKIFNQSLQLCSLAGLWISINKLAVKCMGREVEIYTLFISKKSLKKTFLKNLRPKKLICVSSGLGWDKDRVYRLTERVYNLNARPLLISSPTGFFLFFFIF